MSALLEAQEMETQTLTDTLLSPSETISERTPIAEFNPGELNPASVEAMHQQRYLVNGELRQWSGATENVISPLDLDLDCEDGVIGSYPALGTEEAQEIVQAAKAAYNDGLGVWAQSSMIERVGSVMNFVAMMEDARGEVVKRIILEIGKTPGDAEKEFDRTVEYIKRSCDEALRVYTESKRVIREEGTEATVTREPLGTVLCMGPFNYPLNETFTTMLPALLMGNSVVMKPPKKGVLLFDPLLEAFQESFPPGVVNLVYGDGAEVISPIMQSGAVDALAFIGTPKVADIVSSQHPEQYRLKKILGLGSKNPVVIFSDADLAQAVEKSVKGGLKANGQRCTAPGIHFVERSVAAEYVDRAVSAVEGLKRGQPWEDGVQITPLAEGPDKIAYLQELIEDAVANGAQIMNEGGGQAEGNLFTPAVLYPVTSQMRIYNEEQFGPIVAIAPISSPGTAVEYLAQSPYGQQISLFGRDERRLLSMAKLVKSLVGRVNMNDECKRGPDILPFTGRKGSAMGTLSIRDALNEFSTESVLARPVQTNKSRKER